MVLVLAALYSLYRSNSESPQKKAEEEKQRQREQAAGGEHPSAASDETPSPSQKVADSLLRGGSQLYQSAILRCAGPQHDSSMENDVLVPAATRTASRSSSSSHSSGSGSRSHPNNISPCTSSPLIAVPNEADIFLPSVKQEWIDGVFGKEFCQAIAKPRIRRLRRPREPELRARTRPSRSAFPLNNLTAKATVQQHQTPKWA